MNGGQEVLDSLLGYPTDIEGAVTFWRERIGVEGDERVLRAMLLKRIIKSEEAGKVSCICYKSCPY